MHTFLQNYQLCANVSNFYLPYSLGVICNTPTQEMDQLMMHKQMNQLRHGREGIENKPNLGHDLSVHA